MNLEELEQKLLDIVPDQFDDEAQKLLDSVPDDLKEKAMAMITNAKDQLPELQAKANEAIDSASAEGGIIDKVKDMLGFGDDAK